MVPQSTCSHHYAAMPIFFKKAEIYSIDHFDGSVIELNDILEPPHGGDCIINF
jgi:hypothetical protein